VRDYRDDETSQKLKEGCNHELIVPTRGRNAKFNDSR